MSDKANNWDELLKNYEESGLTKRAYCKEKELLLSQFEYRWRQRLKAQKKNSAKNGFEVISIRANHSTDTLSEKKVVRLYFPNQIHCEFEMDFRSNQMASLLSHLVSLC